MEIKALAPVVTGLVSPAAALPPAAAKTAPVTPVDPLPMAEAIASGPAAGMGIYLRSTASEGIPNWVVLTALRAYGLNIVEETAPAPKPTEVAAAQAKAAVAAQVEPAPVRPKALPVAELKDEPKAVDVPVAKVTFA